ncbi:hypothetical protein [Glutamicibacter uratoxydans]|uniref:hypothetical protein n=1 Tax=Glutamicibacter uratoxydans TaxID=43667 RepID=UPI003D6F1F81
MAQMGAELIEQWADVTAEIYNESLTGINLTRLEGAVDKYIELFAETENLTFNPDITPLDYFERHPFHAVTSILNMPEAQELLDSDQLDELDAIADFTEAWNSFDAEQEPELGISEADDEDEDW